MLNKFPRTVMRKYSAWKIFHKFVLIGFMEFYGISWNFIEGLNIHLHQQAITERLFFTRIV